MGAAALLLSLLPVLPAVAAAEPLPLPPPEVAVEAAPEYTPFTRLTRDAAGKSSVRIYEVPAFTRHAGGWRAVDTTLVPNVDLVAAPAIAARVPQGYRALAFGRTSAQLVTVGLGGGPVTLSSTGLAIAAPNLSSDSAEYSNVAQDTDLTVQPVGAGFRTLLKLKSAQAPTSFTFHLSDPEGQLGTVSPTRDGGFLFSGQIEDDVRMGVRPAVAFVRDPDHPEYAPVREAGSASLTIVPAGDGFDITETVDPQWLAGKPFPVYLDPDVFFGRATGYGTRDCHVADRQVQSYQYCYEDRMEVGFGSGSGTAASTRRALTQFDLNSAVPSNATISRATMRLHVRNNFHNRVISTHAYRIGKDWHQDFTSWTWTGWEGWSGGDPQEQVSEQVQLYWEGDGYDYTITDLARQWRSGARPQHGVAIVIDNEWQVNGQPATYDNSAVISLHSQESSDSQRWPYMHVEYYTPPDAPGSATATEEDSASTVSWTAPGYDGGQAVTHYLIYPYDYSTGSYMPAIWACGGCRSVSVPGLTNGRHYTFWVQAHNGAGGGNGIFTNNVSPRRAPSGLSVSASLGDSRVDVYWSLADDGGRTVDEYMVSASDLTTGTPLPARFFGGSTFHTAYTGLINGHSYRFQVRASTNYASVTTDAYASPGTTPGGPLAVTATSNATSVTVQWSPPTSDGGRPITSYEITGTNTTTGAAMTTQTCSASCLSTRSATFTGLTGGHDYSFTVRAFNAFGAGPPTAAVATVPFLPLGLSKAITSPASSAYGPGDVVTFAVTLTNPNPVGAYARLTDTASPGLALVTDPLRRDTGACPTLAACDLSTSSITMADLYLQPNSSRTITYNAQVLNTARTCALLTNQAQATATSAPGGGGRPLPAPAAAGTQLTGCDAGLGLETWWSYLSRAAGPQATASLNTGTGNLVLQSTDTTPVAARGHLTFALTRTYNSAARPGVQLPGSFGAGWTFGFGEVQDSAGVGTAGSALIAPSLGSALATVTDPLAVVLADRDGTRHAFTPRLAGARVPALAVATPSGAVAGLADTPQAVLAPVALAVPAGKTACVDVTYKAPPGVHLSLWRYIATSNSNCSATAQDAPLVLGYAAVRTDRLRSEYDIAGRLLDVRDASGTGLRYVYGSDAAQPSFNRLVTVYEPRSCTLSQVDAPGSTCRAFRLDYSAAAAATPEIRVSDPARRITRYQLSGSLSSASNPNLVKVINPDGGTLAYTYGGCGGSATQLCSATEPRNGRTQFTYSAGTVAGGPARVSSITDRRGTRTDLSYPDAGSATADTASGTSAAGQRTRYLAIDASGRVGRIEQGDSAGSVARRATYTWDTSGAGGACRQPEAAVDNNLCRVTQDAMGDAAGDASTSYLYNNEGQPLRERAHLAAGTLDTTHGYRAQYVPASGPTTTYEDRVGPGGAVTSAPATGARGTAATLFAVSDRIETLTARGNSAGTAWAAYRTSRLVDADPSKPINAAPAGTTCLAADGIPTATGNTGLLCESLAPAFDATGLPTRTVHGYDGFGAKTTMFTAKALAAAGRAAAGSSVAGVPRYSYSYYESTTDLSGTTDAAGWLRAVSDPSSPATDAFGSAGHFVTFAYDAAGNTARTWDRDATAVHALTEYPGSVPAPGPGPHTEELRAATAGAPIGTALAAPWRYVTSSRDRSGNLTRHARDGNGNVTTLTPPRGTAGSGSSSFDITSAYDPGDLTVTVRKPLDPTPGTTLRYDAFGNLSYTTAPDTAGEAAGRHTVLHRYDVLNRRVATRTSRGDGTAADGSTSGAGCRAATSSDAPLVAGRVYCQTIAGYDRLDNVVAVTDGARQMTTYQYDAAHRRTVQLSPRTPNNPPTLRTETRYDADGNITDVCRPRQFSDGATGCTATSTFGTHTAYDPAGRVSTVTRYRSAGQPLTTRNTYDADGNLTGTTSPRAAEETGDFTTDTAYDLLGRPVNTDTPRAGVSHRLYSPSGDLLAQMLPGSDGDNAAGSGAGRAFRITGYSYDANHRVNDVVRALQVPGATPASDPAAVAAAVANALPDENAQVNLRTRVQYDDDGNVIREYGPRAFLHTDGSATSAPNLAVPDRRHLTSTTYDSNSRIIARFVPRADSAAGPLADPTGEADQSQQCRTGTAGYPAGVGVCISEFGYDSVGNVVTVKLPTRTSAADSSRIMTATYTDDNLRRAVSGPDPSAPAGNSRSVALNRREYDGAGRTVATINALDQKTTYTYSADGLLEGETAPPGQSGQLVHDVRHDHDDDGNRIRTRSSRSTYEPATGLKLGNRNETDFAATEYYADGLVRSVVTGRTLSTSPTDTSGDIRTSYVYDGDGNAVEVKSPSANALDQNNLGGVPTRNTYTPDNLLATSTVPVVATTPIAGQSRVTTYSYDPAGRKTRTVHALSNVPNSSTDQLLSYYPSDLVKTQTGRDEGTGRPTITATYDAAGSPTSTVNDAVTSPTHSTTATYYLDGLLRTFSNTAGASDSYSYDGAGTVLARSHDTTSTTPVTTTYATNNAGLPVTMQAPTEGTAATTSGYDQLGRLATRTRSNGLRETWDYDTDGLLTAAQVQTPSGNVLASNTYTHDEFGRIITQAYYGVGAPSDTGLATSDVPAAAPVTYRYTYDPGGRLSSFTDPIGTRTITFDRNGNRTAFGTPGQPRATTFTYRADDSILGGVAPATPLAAVPTQARAYTHMTWGGVAHDGCSGYSYDGFDRLTEVGRASEVLGCTSGFATYQYDGLDRQVIRTDKTANRALISITAYNYDGGGQTVSGQVNTPAAGTSNPLTYVLDTDGAPLTGSYKGKKQFLFEDGTGSIGLVTGTDKAVLCTARYDAFGNPAGNSAVASAASCNTGSADTENFYRGGRRDGYTGAYQLGSRTYDPSKSAFLTPDSYRTEGSVANAGIGVDPLTRNSYTYVNGDPVNFKDPSGHRQIEGDTGPAASGNVRSDEGTGDGTGRWRAAGGAIMGKQVSYYCATCNRKAMALLGETGVYEGLEDKIVRFGVEDYEGCATGLRGWSGGWKTAFSCAVSIPILKPLKGLDLAADAVRSGNKLEAGRVARDAPTAAEAGAKTELPSGYSSFSAAKRNMGSPGQGNVFDHVVEQSQIRRSGFAPEEIHNPFNMNPVSAGTNQLKANYYSSKQPFTGGGPVRDWLSGQSFADQYEFGIDVLRKIQNGIPLS